MKTTIHIKRVYDPSQPGDGCRILVDRIWPRGLTKEAADIGEWAKSLAPTPALRKWFGHDPVHWVEFQRRYKQELKKNQTLDQFVEKYRDEEKITLVYGAKDTEHNQAVVLQAFLRELFNSTA